MAKEINTKINVDAGAATTSLKALKAELKAVQNELAGLEEGSDSFNKVATKAGALKDQIKDIQEVTSAQAGPAVERLSNQFSLLGNDLKNLDFQGASGKISGLASTVKSVKFSDFTGGIKEAGTALLTLGKAILASPIGILAAAIGAVVGALALWKSEAMAVNSALAAQADMQQKIVDAELSDIEAVSGKTEQLKLQGKSQREILELKQKETSEAITALEAQLTTQEEIKRQQVESAKRNKEILSGIIQFITIPLQVLLGVVDQVGKAVGKDLGLRDKFNDFTASLLFDPEEVAAEADKTIKTTRDQLEKLKESRAGYQNSINDIDRTAREKRQAELDKELEAQKKAYDEAYKRRVEQEDELYKIGLNDRERKEQALLEEYEKRFAAAEGNAELEEALQRELQQRLLDMYNEFRKKDLESAQEYSDKRAAQQDAIYKLGLNDQDSEELALMEKYDTEIALAEGNAELQRELTERLQSDLADVNQKYRDQELQRDIEQHEKRANNAQMFVNGMNNLNTALSAIDDIRIARAAGNEGKLEQIRKQAFKRQKALQIAQATIDTYKGAVGAYAQTISTIPAPAGPIVAAVMAGVAVAAGLAQIAKISSTKYDGGGGGGGAASAGATPSIGGGSNLAIPQPSPVSLNNNSIDKGGATSITGQQDSTVKVVVLESDITSTQKRVDKLSQFATIG